VGTPIKLAVVGAGSATFSQGVGAQKSVSTHQPVEHHDGVMLDYLRLMIELLRAALRRRSEVVAEKLLLRHQLLILTHPTRKRPRLHAHDKLF
jgi:hypothetical protein